MHTIFKNLKHKDLLLKIFIAVKLLLKNVDESQSNLLVEII